MNQYARNASYHRQHIDSHCFPVLVIMQNLLSLVHVLDKMKMEINYNDALNVEYGCKNQRDAIQYFVRNLFY